MTSAGLEGVELLQLEVLELESGPCCIEESSLLTMQQIVINVTSVSCMVLVSTSNHDITNTKLLRNTN
jgi:hypothetical protein